MVKNVILLIKLVIFRLSVLIRIRRYNKFVNVVKLSCVFGFLLNFWNDGYLEMGFSRIVIIDVFFLEIWFVEMGMIG